MIESNLPLGWVKVTIGELSEIVSGGTPPTNVDNYYEGGEIPWITPADLSGYRHIYISRGKRNITQAGLQNSSARIVPKNTVLFSSRAPIGYVAIAENELTTNQGFKSIIPSPAFEPKYLYWYLRNSKALVESYASGTTFKEVSGSKMAQIPIRLNFSVKRDKTGI